MKKLILILLGTLFLSVIAVTSVRADPTPPICNEPDPGDPTTFE